MKRYILLVVLFCLAVPSLRAQDNEMNMLMPERALTRKDVQYNLMKQVPRLHSQGKEDTLFQMISFANKNFSPVPELAPYVILHSIKNRTFKEDIRYTQVSAGKSYVVADSAYYTQYILGYFLSWYQDKFRNRKEDNEDPLYYRELRSKYIAFVAAWAKEIKNTPGLTPVESWLVNYFIDPRQDMYQQLHEDAYKGSLLQKAWVNYHQDELRISGIGYGITAGIWSPVGKLSILGNHPSIGYTIGSKTVDNFIFDFRIDVRFLRSPAYYNVQVDTQMLRTNYFIGFSLGLDGGYEIKKRMNAIDFIGGIAYEGIGTISSRDYPYLDFNSSYYNNRNTGGRSSFCMNAGLAYKRYLTHRVRSGNIVASYISLQARYHWLFFNNFSGTDLSGGAWTIGLSYGGYSRSKAVYKQ